MDMNEERYLTSCTMRTVVGVVTGDHHSTESSQPPKCCMLPVLKMSESCSLDLD